jgi:hypothetical protein
MVCYEIVKHPANYNKLFSYQHFPHFKKSFLFKNVSQSDRPVQKLSHVTVRINVNTIYAKRIMLDFTITKFFESLSHETKFIMISEGILHAKGHSRQPSYSGSNITFTFDTGTSCWLAWSEERWKWGIPVFCHSLKSINLQMMCERTEQASSWITFSLKPTASLGPENSIFFNDPSPWL